MERAWRCIYIHSRLNTSNHWRNTSTQGPTPPLDAQQFYARPSTSVQGLTPPFKAQYLYSGLNTSTQGSTPQLKAQHFHPRLNTSTQRYAFLVTLTPSLKA